MDGLIGSVHNSKIGCFVGNKPSNIFVYADDIILLGPTVSSMKHLLNICDSFGSNNGLEFNPDKCEYLFFSKNHKVSIQIYLL